MNYQIQTLTVCSFTDFDKISIYTNISDTSLKLLLTSYYYY